MPSSSSDIAFSSMFVLSTSESVISKGFWSCSSSQKAAICCSCIFKPSTQGFSGVKQLILWSLFLFTSIVQAHYFNDCIIISFEISFHTFKTHVPTNLLETAFKFYNLVCWPFVIKLDNSGFERLVPDNIRSLNALSTPSRYDNTFSIYLFQKIFHWIRQMHFIRVPG